MRKHRCRFADWSVVEIYGLHVLVMGFIPVFHWGIFAKRSPLVESVSVFWDV